MDRKKLGIIMAALIVVAVSTVVIVNTPTPPDGTTTTTEEPHSIIIGELFASLAHFLIVGEDGNGYFLSDGMSTVLGNNSYEEIGNISNTKDADDSGYGFRILWNGTFDYDYIIMSIVLTFPMEDYYDEDKYDYYITFVATINHNVTFEYNFGVIVSQQIFYPESVIWDFERIGTISKADKFIFETTLLDNSSYHVVRVEGKENIITPRLEITCPIESDFCTEMIIHYARIDVISQAP